MLPHHVLSTTSTINTQRFICVIGIVLVLVTKVPQSYCREYTENIENSKHLPSKADASEKQIIAWDKKWPGGVIYYDISPHFNATSRELIYGAMKKISEKTCIRYQKRTTQPDYIYFQDTFGDGCHTYAGRKGGKQLLNLDPQRCIQHGKIMHELLHVLGFHHEHQRSDRDHYISIMWDNIKTSDWIQLQKLKAPHAYLLGFPYDYGSILHYGNVSFYLAVDREKPILLSKRYAPTMGQRIALSELDTKKVNILYECQETNIINENEI